MKDTPYGHYKDLPEMLHDWYLEATGKLDPKSYNPDAAKPYRELTPEQQFIDKYIADKIMQTFGLRLGQDVESSSIPPSADPALYSALSGFRLSKKDQAAKGAAGQQL